MNNCEGELPSVLYTIYKSSYPTVVRKWTIARWGAVCIIYYIQIELPRSCSEMNNCEVRCRLYYILYTNRATPQLFGNEQLRGELPSVLYTIYKSSYPAVVRKWTIARWGAVLHYILYTNRATPQLFGNEQLRGELPSVLYTIYKSSYPAVVRKWTIARWGAVCIIYYIQIELPRSCSEMNNCEVSSRLHYIPIYKSSYPAVVRKWTIARWAPVCIIYYIQIELPRSCSEMNNCEVRCRLHYILYTNRATPQLFGNEQLRGELPSVLYAIYKSSYFAVVRKWKLRGEVPSVLYTIYKSSYPAVVRKWTIARWAPVCNAYYIQIALLRSCSEMNNCKVSSRL